MVFEIGAALVLLVSGVISRFIGSGALIGAVNLNLQHARLLSVGVKWLVIVLAVAMALEHLKIAAGVVQLGFGILFGGIVFALALAVGLGSKDLSPGRSSARRVSPRWRVLRSRSVTCSLAAFQATMEACGRE